MKKRYREFIIWLDGIPDCMAHVDNFTANGFNLVPLHT